MAKGKMGKFESQTEGQILYLKASVLKRNGSIVATPDPSLLIRLGLFAQGLTKAKLGGIVDGR